MSLPKKDSLDLSLEHSLKNWVTRKQPPVDGKASLLQAAINATQFGGLKTSLRFHVSSNKNYAPHERLTISDLYTLPPGLMGLFPSMVLY